MAALSNYDTKFLQDMIVHHQSALEMSQAYLDAPADHRLAKVSDLARNIISAQTDEIAMMTEWLKSEGKPVKSSGSPSMRM